MWRTIITAILFTCPVGIQAYGQAAPVAPSGPPNCTASMVDTSLYLTDLPAQRQSLSFDFQNRSAQTCTLTGVAWLREPQGAGLPACWQHHCSEPISHEVPREHPPFLLVPDGKAHLEFEWSRNGSGAHCDHMMGLQSQFGSLQATFSSESSPLSICSTVAISDLLPGESSAAIATREFSAQYPLSVSLNPETLYSDETANLTIKPPNGNPLHQIGCADIYLTFHGQPELPPAPGPQLMTPCSAFGGSYRSKEPWNPDSPIVFEEKGDVLQNADSLQWHFVDEQGSHQMLIAPLHFRVLSPDTLEKHWGRNAGLAISLSIDRSSAAYTANEGIWCHVDWVNEAASKRIGIDELGSQIPWIEVEDSTHKEITSFSLFSEGSGHGWGPFEVKRNDPNSMATKLPDKYITDENKPALPLFPHPGVYYVYAVWAPPLLLGKHKRNGGPSDGTALGKTYAIVKSDPIKVTILPTGETTP